jgi:hypothetical protein
MDSLNVLNATRYRQIPRSKSASEALQEIRIKYRWCIDQMKLLLKAKKKKKV